MIVFKWKTHVFQQQNTHKLQIKDIMSNFREQQNQRISKKINKSLQTLNFQL